jgi:hypothetical protein
MRITRSTPMVLLLPFLLMILAGCEENTVGPGTGSGALLETEIDGVKFSLTPDVGIQNSYNVSLESGRFRGTGSGTPVRSLTVLIYTNLDSGSFPRTLAYPEVSYVYIETTNGVDSTFDVTNDPTLASLTISGKSTTATGSTLISGTFSGRVTNTEDRSKSRTFTNGKFSIDLSRQ